MDSKNYESMNVNTKCEDNLDRYRYKQVEGGDRPNWWRNEVNSFITEAHNLLNVRNNEYT